MFRFTTVLTTVLIFVCSAPSLAQQNQEQTLAQAFGGFKWNSQFEVAYDDIDQLLAMTVVNTGMSDRSRLKSEQTIGTRMTSGRNKATALEANRFYFEGVKKSDLKLALTKIRESLENLPQEMPLSELNKKEQLAYWLNLYNMTLLEQLVKRYPLHSLDDEIEDEGLLDAKLITVAGHPLSLNDIQQRIVYPNFAEKPNVIYGFYQGYIGSPSLHPAAFKGATVYKQLEKRAEEFINSNRGAQVDDEILEVSQYYQQATFYFPQLQDDLKRHIAIYAKGQFEYDLRDVEKVEIEIEDYTLADLTGSGRQIGGGVASNQAGMLDAVVNGSGGQAAGMAGADGGLGAQNVGVVSQTMQTRTADFGRFTPEQAEILRKIREKQEIAAGSVEIKDIDKEKKEKSEN
ncbi:DUF547 domain-containing protein [Pseudoalteromonas ruthenica]|uniref:DUF547 domain-containing protein n=1 Tax=Pseudoalteromonas ruthenica TaxID=151081 RepID=UPI00241C9D1F|nr:DUF547 domain-containing protein [Pseudoalteromonas ruthenica]